jgi:protein phosphatase
MNLEFSALTDRGLVRANNEDTVLVDADHGLAVLADGMGGYQAGEVASALAVEQIAGELRRWLASNAAPDMGELRRAVASSVDSANRKILDTAHADPACAGMGATLVMAVAQGAKLLVGHAGDSRAYRWRAGKLVQLTRDHSLLQEQIDRGLLTPRQAARSASRGLVTRALGVEARVLLDMQEVPMIPGDIYLLCSDGLTDMLRDARIAALVKRPLPLDQLARELIDGANHAGGHDNVSVALIRARHS